MSDLYFLDENYNAFIDIVNELYVGETEFIKKFQAEISKARAPYVGKLKKPIKGNKDFIKIGDMIAEEFGFHAVTFSVPYDVSMNAFTYPITMAIDQTVIGKKPKFFKDQGFKYDPQTSKMCVIVAVTSGVWFNPEFTDREVVAAILHEIGHSFVLQSERTIDIIEANRLGLAYNLIFNIVLKLFNPALWVTLPNDLKTIMNASNKGREIINHVSKELAENPLFKPFNGASAIADWLSGIFMNVLKELLYLFETPVNLATLPILVLSKLLSFIGDNSQIAIGRSQEYLSDSFATMYGYGPDASSFLLKIEYSSKASGSMVNHIRSKIPVIGALHQTLNIPILLLADSMNTHPSTPARIDKILNELKQELKESDLDPKTKKAVESNIKDLERIKKETLMPQTKKTYDAEMVKRSWIAFLTNKGNFMNDHEKYYTDLKARDKYVRESLDILDDINLI